MLTFKVYFRNKGKSDSAFVQALSKNDVGSRLLARFPKSALIEVVAITGRKKEQVL